MLFFIIYESNKSLASTTNKPIILFFPSLSLSQRSAPLSINSFTKLQFPSLFACKSDDFTRFNPSKLTPAPINILITCQFFLPHAACIGVISPSLKLIAAPAFISSLTTNSHGKSVPHAVVSGVFSPS